MTSRAQAVLDGDDSKKHKLTTEELRWLDRQKKKSAKKSVKESADEKPEAPKKKVSRR